MPSVTKHLEDLNHFLSVKNMSEEGLEHDHITVNTNMYCEILLQQDNQKFIYESQWQLPIVYVSREKKTFSRPLIKNIINQNNNSCLKRPLTVK